MLKWRVIGMSCIGTTIISKGITHMLATFLLSTIYAGEVETAANAISELSPQQVADAFFMAFGNNETRMLQTASTIAGRFDAEYEGKRAESAMHPLVQVVLRNLTPEALRNALLGLDVGNATNFDLSQNPDFAGKPDWQAATQGAIDAMLPLVTDLQTQNTDRLTTEQNIAHETATNGVLNDTKNNLGAAVTTANLEAEGLAAERDQLQQQYNAKVQEHTQKIAHRDSLSQQFNDKVAEIAESDQRLSDANAHLTTVQAVMDQTADALNVHAHTLVDVLNQPLKDAFDHGDEGSGEASPPPAAS